jgi:hypothetical protein
MLPNGSPLELKRRKTRSKITRDKKIWSGGEFHDPSRPSSIPTEMAQRQFLIIASELYGVTADLRRTVLPHFRGIGAPLEEDALGRVMKAWCDRYRFWQPWVLKQVLETLTLWAIAPQVARMDEPNPPWHPLFHLIIRRPRPATTVPFVFNYLEPNFEITVDGTKEWSEPAGWDLELERKEEFIAEARSQFNAALKTYCEDQERNAKDRGLVRVKRSRSRRYDQRSNMTWVVQRHCGPMSFEDIAQAHTGRTGQNVDVSTIIKRVKEISELIDLTSRVDFNPPAYPLL